MTAFLFSEMYKKKTSKDVLFYIIYPGNVLLSHIATHAVPSAIRGLTSVFGMGTGVALFL